MKSIFLRLNGESKKSDALLSSIQGLRSFQTFAVDPDEFSAVPGSPLSYWVAPALRHQFRKHPAFGGEHRFGIRGAYTTDDFRFYRLVWEVLPSSRAATREQTGTCPNVPVAKGGRFSRLHADVYLSVRWGNDGREAKAFLSAYRSRKGWGEDWSACLNGYSHYFRPGLTWPLRTSGLSFRAMPGGCIFSHKGPAAFVEGDSETHLLVVAALANSIPFDALVRMQTARTELAQSFEVGLIQQTPMPMPTGEPAEPIARAARRSWSLKRSLDTITETSHAFLLPALLQVEGRTLADRAAAWSARVAATEAELAAIQREIDDIAFRLYGIDGEDRARIEAESGAAPAAAPTDEEAPDAEAEAADEPDDDEDDDTGTADAATLATELLSWAVGGAFGRFDLDLATGRRESPPEPGPFDPLPARSPGMVPDDSRAVEVLVDDEGHPEDIVARVTRVFAAVFGEHHEARLDEAVRLAGAPDLRTWLRRSFFPFHLKRYSKSRRKAPIWWPLSTASGSYTLWVAWPRLTRDTLYRLTSEQEPYVAAKVAQEARKLTSLKQDAGKSPTSAQAKAIGAQEEFVAELTALRDELAMVAPMWNPVHDDGVVLHAALLWRVVRDAGWQKECREKWEGLVAGKYDWAHIALHLWPERAVPKCREDRSLAIAHGLEERFWVEIAGKWRLRDATDQAMNEEVTARSSAAVKKALRAMQEAPAPVRGRSGRRAS